MQGSPNEIFSRARELEIFGLNVPKATFIAQKLREKGLPLPNEIFSGEDLKKALCELL